jgi:uncharacterized protein (DUF1778 family)|tara:strand:+ start:1744 stop:1974 length:231 start_codon:yes stop_codon:yes gene_type:complete
MAKKKVKKSAARIAAKISDEQKKLLLALINHSSDVVRSTLEVGSAMANDCIKTQESVWDVAREFGFDRGDYWSEYK